MIHPVRVIFGDTDQMGVVYYANYLRYFEASRAAYLRALGKSGKDLARLGIGFPVVEAQCRYRKPAYYEDVLEVEVSVADLRAASLRFVYQVRRASDLLAEGFTLHACATPEGRPTRIPAELRTLIEQARPRQ
jgi:acyl-CoA thioester hydrolase